jgi:hypothetical protein
MKNVSDAVLALINDTIFGTIPAPMITGDFSPDFSPDFLLTSVLASDGQPTQFVDFDCYTITLASGAIARFTTADFNITDGANVWRCDLVRVDEQNSRVTAHWKEGFDVDTMTLVMMPRSVDVMTGAAFPDTINGVPWLQAAQGGALDGARLQRDWAVFSGVPTWPMPAAGAQPVGFIHGIFVGLVGVVDTNATIAVLNVNDYRCLLDTDVPKHIFSSGCRFTLFDVDCSLSAAAFKRTGSAIGGSTPGSIANTLPSPGGGLTYLQGRVTMTSGQNSGFSRTVTAWNGAGQPLGLIVPFPFPIISGDTFDVYPGCAKTQVACTAFGNKLNFGGQSYVPAPEAAL